MPTPAFQAHAVCGVCSEPAVTALLVGKSHLATCRACAQRLVDGEFLYSPHPELRLRKSMLAEGPVAYPLRAVQ